MQTKKYIAMLVILMLLISNGIILSAESDDVIRVQWVPIEAEEGNPQSHMVIDSFNGVEARYNLDGNMNTRYQCDELVGRYYDQQFGIPYFPAYFDQPEIDYSPFKLSQSPKAGDIALWPQGRRDDRPYPHYAIIKEVKKNSIVLLEQNFTWDNKAPLKREVKFPSDRYDVWTLAVEDMQWDYEPTVNLPYELLEKVDDQKSALDAVEKATERLYSEHKNQAVPVDQLTLFTEEAIAQAASQTVKEDNIKISGVDVEKLENTAEQVKSAVNKVLTDAGVTAHRELQTGIKYKATGGQDKISITIDSAVSKSESDYISIETDDYSLTLDKDYLQATLGSDPIIINVETELLPAANTPQPVPVMIDNNLFGFDENFQPMVLAALNLKKVKVEIKKPVNKNIKIAMPPSSGETDYQAVVNDNGSAVGGKYNPASNKVEANISQSGTYHVKENFKNFTDIRNKSEAMSHAILVLASKGIISGTSATEFSPDASISRAEIAALIVRTLSKLDPQANGGFTDVNSSDWFFGAAGSAKKHGIMSGTSASMFEPRSSIKKDQLVAVAARTLKEEMKYTVPSNVEQYLAAYNDRAEIPTWGRGDIALATRENMVAKRLDRKFGPGGHMTRGDAAVILYRMFMKIW